MSETNSLPEISELFTQNRFPSAKWKCFLLCLYFPLGALIMIFRILLGLHIFLVSCILRKTWAIRTVVLRVMCTVLGIVVVEEGSQNKEANVLVANHVSPVDYLVLQIARPCVLPSVWDLPPLLMWIFGYLDLGAIRGRNVLIENAKKFCETCQFPLLAFPEGAMTNGQRGFLKFSSWPFALNVHIQPVTITVTRPAFADLATIIIGSRWFTDLLWFFFVPYSVFHVKWLDTVQVNENENVDDFAKRVQRKMADSVGLVETPYTSHDAVEYAKRVILEERRRRQHEEQMKRQLSSRTIKTSMELDSMALKVKEMFPQVPLYVIRKDIERTTAIDLTSSNIIEGRLEYQPESIDQQKAPKLSADPSSWRSLYEERKWEIIEENRRKYCQRKKLN